MNRTFLLLSILGFSLVAFIVVAESPSSLPSLRVEVALNPSSGLAMGTNLTARIIFPITNQLFTHENGQVSITGMAAGPGFREYQLVYGRGINPQQWIVINSSTVPVGDLNGLLGTWDARNLETDVYRLSLIVSSQSGETFQDAVQVSVETLPFSRVSPNPYRDLAQKSPAISGEKVVWVENRYIPEVERKPNVFFRNLETGTEQLITNSQSYRVSNPVISGDLIVWADYRRGRNLSNPDLYLNLYIHELSEGDGIEHRITSDSAVPFYHKINGNRIVWEDLRHGSINPDIYSCVYNIVTHECPEEPIAVGSEISVTPSISGNLIVYAGRTEVDNSPWRIFIYNVDTRTTLRVTEGPSDGQPIINGNRITWVGENAGGQTRIYYCDYDISTGSCGPRIVPGTARGSYPLVSGDYIVWLDDSTNKDVWLYDVARGINQEITSEFNRQESAVLSGNRIIWEDYRLDRLSPFMNMYEVPTPVTVTLTPRSTAVRPGENLVLDVTVHNTSNVSRTVNGWINGLGPNGSPYQNNPIFGPQTFTIQPGRTVTRTVRQRIPANRPPSGPYTVRAYIGSYPNDWIDSSSFQFSISP